MFSWQDERMAQSLDQLNIGDKCHMFGNACIVAAFNSYLHKTDPIK